MVSIITFGSSFILLLLLFLGRFFENLQGKKNPITFVLSLLDKPSEKIISALSFRWKQVNQTIRYIVFIVIPQRSEEAFKQMKGRAVDNYNKKKDALMGKKDLPLSTSASFYLKKIKEDKQNGKSGKIVDSL